jgi:hypothetical protein
MPKSDSKYSINFLSGQKFGTLLEMTFNESFCV